MAWEYLNMTEHIWNFHTENWQQKLNDMGSVGWELCAVTVVPASTTQPASFMGALLKRERPDYPPPRELAAGWKNDPSRKFLHRWWDGIRWTEGVNDGGENLVDFPDPRKG